ncbi:hypothetical protein [Actinokineospora spheciospongiae]|nr:hypothetical protein [Actinokineospora spheciospongiae]
MNGVGAAHPQDPASRCEPGAAMTAGRVGTGQPPQRDDRAGCARVG